MKITVLGLNYKSAPIEVRERLMFDSDRTITALKQLKNRFPDAEFVLLSTCNRIELYCAHKLSQDIPSDELAGFLSQFQHVPLVEFQEFLYTYDNDQAVRHLLMVASSLDSMVVGEPQIISQVKESYRLACSAKSTGKILNRLFHCAFAASKNIYSTTSISYGRVSVASVAVELAMQLFADISSSNVVVIGTGEMGELLVQHLLQAGCKNITIINRSYEHGLNIAKRYNVTAGKWQELQGQLADANIVIASATTKDYLFKKDSLKEIMDVRRAGILLIIDIAVPRNFEPSINEIDDIYLYSIDDLSEVVERNRKAREQDIDKGMQIVRKNVIDFMDWLGVRDIGPMIGQMKEQFALIAQNELERFFVGVRKEAFCREVLEAMVHRIVNKMLHCVIKNVDVIAKKNGPAEAAKFVGNIARQAEEITSELTGKGDKQS
jgi:glutamyl-tRNA reductase